MPFNIRLYSVVCNLMNEIVFIPNIYPSSLMWEFLTEAILTNVIRERSLPATLTARLSPVKCTKSAI